MLRLEIVTPEKKVVDAEVDSVTVPTLSGEVGIMAAHAPLISALKPGVLSYSQKGNVERLAISTGFVEVSKDLVSVLTDFADSADDIDLQSARLEKEEAERELASVASSAVEETESIREKIDHANAKITVARG
ncbi:ATP synthase F1 subunit epsilon [Leptolyngbya sp. 7M]|uniref:ATP synthase F1 subunit epsilon n=1 Tax=Leptolyngbya sp. 7M TaxID=2812896 RepID=UPI001B8B4287|nr:ATP synthase F1 subunit epsilon [Leptolyngbya sp. 7M]QYO66815.1 ATP synthase F1 subunit epsilon [Leptolyngbya sp. 7M]